MEVAPTAHHFMGGIRITPDCETNIENLYAAGEVTSGVHGANRLGGNALADTQVFGNRAGLKCSENIQTLELTAPSQSDVDDEIKRIEDIWTHGKYDPEDIKEEIQDIMWKYVAIVRDEQGLLEAQSQLNQLEKMTLDMDVPSFKQYNSKLMIALEVISMLQLARLIVKSALLRKESRGAHFRSDYPELNDEEYLKSFVLNKDEDVKTVERGLF